MKKIKLLLLGIISIIGLGFSFALNEPFAYVSSSTRYEVTIAPNDDTNFGSAGDCYFFYLSLRENSSVLVSFDNGLTFSSGGTLFNFICGDSIILHNTSNSSKTVRYYLYSGLFDNVVKDSYQTWIDYGNTSQTQALAKNSNGLINFPNYNPGDCYFLPGNGSSYSYYLNLYQSYTGQFNQIPNFNSLNGAIICGSGVYARNTSTSYAYGISYSLLSGLMVSSVPDEPEDITTPLIPVDGSPFDIMGLYIRQYVLCKMTSGHLYPGAVGSCDGFQWEEFFEGHSTMIDDDETRIRMSIYSGYWFLSNYCASVSNNFLVPFCSQLDLYEDSQVDYFLFKDNWDLRMYILGSGFNLELSFSSGGLLSSQCFGVWCPDFVKTGDFQYIPDTGNNNANSFTGFLVDQSFYNVNNGNRLFFNCPYPYSGSYLVIAQNLIDNLGGVDILKPINCFISAFSYGDKTLYFGDPESNTSYWSGSLINGDSYSHKLLFSFFDLILSIGIFVLLRKLFKF